MRAAGTPYTSLEAAGVYLPVVVAHVEYLAEPAMTTPWK